VGLCHVPLGSPLTAPARAEIADSIELGWSGRRVRDGSRGVLDTVAYRETSM